MFCLLISEYGKLIKYLYFINNLFPLSNLSACDTFEE